MPRISSLLVILSPLVMTVACQEWPPVSEQLSSHVLDRKSQIENLVAQFEATDFHHIECQECVSDTPVSEWTTRSYRLVDEEYRVAENPREEEFAKMLYESGSSYVLKFSNGSVDIGIGAATANDDREYAIQIFHNPQHSSDLHKECVSEFENVECGRCKVSIDDSLWIRYQWYPKVIDAELHESIANGELPYGEWQERHTALLDACFESGLIEQGYENISN